MKANRIPLANEASPPAGLVSGYRLRSGLLLITLLLVAIDAMPMGPSPTSPHLNTTAIVPGTGQNQLQLLAVPDEVYVIQASTNLANWTAIATNSADSQGVVNFTDPQSASFIQRFYRGILPIASAGAPLEAGTQSVVSDDFSGGSLNPSLWTFINPLGDGNLSTTEGVLRISVPAGSRHDLFGVSGTAKGALRVMQSVTNADFEVEIRLQSVPQIRFQLQGLIVEQDADDYVRFDLHSDGASVRLLAASIVNGGFILEANLPVDTSPVYFMRVNRQGDQWTYSYSPDGENWTVGVSFARALIVDQVGVFAGNAGTNPAFDAVVDYVFNTASPIEPEDGGAATITVLTEGMGSVTKAPNQTSYAVGTLVELEATPADNWQFGGWRGDVSGTNNLVDLTISGDHGVAATFVPLNSDAFIDVWYGDHQVVGERGIPQVWANILGNVAVPEEVSSLSLALNGTFKNVLALGGTVQNPRLARPGDFNAEIAYSDLRPGSNEVTLTATLSDGQVFVKTVVVEFRTNAPPAEMAHIDWSVTSAIGDVAQAVDGKWAIEPAGVRVLEPHYDRLIALGDMGWKDYELTVPVTVNGTTPTPSGYTPAVGVALRWQGHYDWDGSQPRVGWHPLGALGWVAWRSTGDPVLEILENDTSRGVGKVRSIAFGIPYIFKMRVESPVGQPAGLYSLKVWEQGQPEPPEWNLTHQARAGLGEGSILLLAHYADATFGNVSVSPIGSGQTNPVVTIIASDATAAEPDDSGTFTVNRTGAATTALMVNYSSRAAPRMGRITRVWPVR